MIINRILKSVSDLSSTKEINNYINNLQVCNNSKRIYLYEIKKYLEKFSIDTSDFEVIPQEFNPVKRNLEFEELQTLFAYPKTLELDFLIHALLDTGARVEEFVKIKWENVVSTEIAIRTAKASNSYRFVFITNSTLNLLTKLKQQNYNFNSLTVKRIQYLFAKVGKRANLSINLSPHVLRRSKGSIMGLNGCALEDIADILGHSNLETTRKYYRKMNSSYLKSVSKLSDVKPAEAVDLQILRQENVLLKKKIILLEMENERLINETKNHKLLE